MVGISQSDGVILVQQTAVFLLQHMPNVITNMSLWFEGFNQRLLTQIHGPGAKEKKQQSTLSSCSPVRAVDGNDSARFMRHVLQRAAKFFKRLTVALQSAQSSIDDGLTQSAHSLCCGPCNVSDVSCSNVICKPDQCHHNILLLLMLHSFFTPRL